MGAMRRILILLLLLAAAGGGAWFWRRHDSARPAPQAAATQNRGASPIAVATVPVEQTNFPIRRRSFGYAEPMASVVVRSRVDSQLLQQHFTEGQFVRKGDLLFTLDDREFAAQLAKDEATLARDQAVKARAQNDLQRAQQLLQRNAGTQQALDVATAESKTADASLQADQAAIDADKLRLSYTRIVAPIAGRIGAVAVTPGNLVHANDTGAGLVTITQIAPIRIAFTAPERDFASIQASASRGRIEVRAFQRGVAKPVSGELTFIDSQVDQSTGTILLKGEFANKDQSIWPGEYVDVEFDTAVHDNALTIPTVAIQQGQNFAYVFVIRDGVAELRKIAPGGADDVRTEILSGLQPGEAVVVDGQMRLSDGARVQQVSTTPRQAARGPS